MDITTNTSRRSFLTNGSKCLGLPFLPSLLPANLQAASEKSSKPVKRLLWMSMGHGHMEKHFYPTATGKLKDMELPPAWKPLQKNLAHTTMISNLTNKQNKQPHEGSEALFSCCNVVGFSGKSRHNSVSCDQVAAEHLGQSTRYESMQLNVRPKEDGNGHGGVAVSYRKDGSPLIGLRTPLEVYHALFGGGLSQQQQLELLKKERSVFDILKIDTANTKRRLSHEDQQKLEEYTSSVRDIELAISRQQDWVNTPYPKAAFGPPEDGMDAEKEMEMMYKLLVTAYQTDSTRIITYRMPDAGLLTSMGLGYSPHTLSHYGSNTVLHELNLKRSTKWLQLYSKLIDMLRTAKDPLDPNGGTIFDNSLVFWGGGLRTAHRNTNVPCFLTGGGFKGIKHGHHHKAAEENTPLANLWTTMLQDAGVPIEAFADANGHTRDIYS